MSGLEVLGAVSAVTGLLGLSADKCLGVLSEVGTTLRHGGQRLIEPMINANAALRLFKSKVESYDPDLKKWEAENLSLEPLEVAVEAVGSLQVLIDDAAYLACKLQSANPDEARWVERIREYARRLVAGVRGRVVKTCCDITQATTTLNTQINNFNNMDIPKRPACVQHGQATPGYPEVEEVIGRKDAVDNFVTELCNSVGNEGKLGVPDVFLVHGPPGVGKTTFLKEVEKHAQVQKTFTDIATIVVGRGASEHAIRQEVINAVSGISTLEYANMSKDELDAAIAWQNKCKGHFLLIFDDAWKTRSGSTSLLRAAMDWDSPNSAIRAWRDHAMKLAKGWQLRVAISSRFTAQDLGLGMQPYLCRYKAQPFELPLDKLSKDDAEALFWSTAGQHCKDALEEDQKLKDILEACDGLPLALVLLATFIAKQEDVQITLEKVVQAVQGAPAGTVGKEEQPLRLLDAAIALSMEPLYLEPLAASMLLDLTAFPQGALLEVATLCRFWQACYNMSEEASKGRLQNLLNVHLLEQCTASSNVRVHDLVHSALMRRAEQERQLAPAMENGTSYSIREEIRKKVHSLLPARICKLSPLMSDQERSGFIKTVEGVSNRVTLLSVAGAEHCALQELLTRVKLPYLRAMLLSGWKPITSAGSAQFLETKQIANLEVIQAIALLGHQ